MNPSKVAFGQNKPAEFSQRCYYDSSDIFPETISSVFADEEIHDEPTKYSDVRNDHHLVDYSLDNKSIYTACNLCFVESHL